MTEKQEKIMNAALDLFANEGFRATSTSKIAKKAGVSEGLIFRHYTNKEGLLNAILQLGEDRFNILLAQIMLGSDPREIILRTIDAFNPSKKEKEEINFWKLQYKIKWEMEMYGEKKLEPLQKLLKEALASLGVDKPDLEAQMLLLTMDGLATRFYLQQTGFSIDDQLDLLKSKYDL